MPGSPCARATARAASGSRNSGRRNKLPMVRKCACSVTGAAAGTGSVARRHGGPSAIRVAAGHAWASPEVVPGTSGRLRAPGRAQPGQRSASAARACGGLGRCRLRGGGAGRSGSRRATGDDDAVAILLDGGQADALHRGQLVDALEGAIGLAVGDDGLGLRGPMPTSTRSSVAASAVLMLTRSPPA